MAQEHIQLPLIGVNYVQHHRGSYIDGVNMEWSDTQRRLCLGACHVISRDCANFSWCAVRFLTAPAVHVCSKTTRHLTAHVPGTGADLRVCMLATRDARIRVVIVAARIKTVYSHKDALAVKKKSYTNIKSNADDISPALDT